ncbi:MAG: ABC transporter permease [Eggerthellaceae bacterium]|nr:ABC transporter permease [Eggerthellaceae bacterium]
MGKYLVRRFLTIFIVLWAVATLTYLLVHISPGDAAELIIIQTYGPEAVSPENLQAVSQKFDLDRPFIVQYGDWLAGVFTGNLGISYKYNAPVADMIAARLPNTVYLGVVSLLISIVLGIPFGIISAIHRNGVIDHVTRLITLFLSSFPGFWVGLMLVVVFAIQLKMFPTSGMNRVDSVVLPAITLSIGTTASITRMMRTSMLDVLGQEYITVARAKGLARRRIVLTHALRNALPPIITVIALSVGHILGGAVVIETIFAWPGVGDLFNNAVLAKDIPMMEGCVLLIAFGYAFANLVADIVYACIDPRVKRGLQASASAA